MPLAHGLPSLLITVAALVLSSPLLAADVVNLTGAGASFPAPLYQRWFRDYYRMHPNVRMDYQAIGSGGGIANFIAGTIDFAGSDLPMSSEDAARVAGGIVQLPMTAGAIVLAYNLPGIDDLKLSREAVAGIFLGKVERWDDPIIRAANDGIELPDKPVTVVTRADASGTTFVVTRHLNAISEEFAKTVGITMTPLWPKPLKERGALIRGRGNAGLAAYIKSVPGAIGYLQYSYAHLTNMAMASVQNQAGSFVPPNSETFHAAVESFRSDLDLTRVAVDLSRTADPLDLTHVANPRGPGSYPVLTLSWLVARRSYEEEKERAMVDVLRYCLTDGQNVTDALGYIPLPEQVRGLLLQQLPAVQ